MNTDRALNISPDRGPNEVVAGRYEVLEKLGEGVHGETFRVCDLEGVPEDTYVLKLLKTKFCEHQSTIDRFDQEAKVMRELGEHPNIIRVLESYSVATDPEFSRGEMSYYLMPDYQLTDLQKFVRDDRTDIFFQPCEKEVVAWAHRFSKLCSALEHWWRAALCVHRDIKPANILISEDATLDGNGDEQIMFCDFGIAKLLDKPSLGVNTPATRRVGTFPWAAPEQANREEVDLRTDIYGLGATLYYMITNREPFDDDPDLMGPDWPAINRCPTPKAHRTNSAVPPRLGELVYAAMEKKKGDRIALPELQSELAQIG